jgi:hypothetical protein
MFFSLLASLISGILGIALDQRKRLAIVVTIAVAFLFSLPLWMSLLLRAR